MKISLPATSAQRVAGRLVRAATLAALCISTHVAPAAALTKIPVKVQLLNPSGTERILNDAKGPYVDGVDKVMAVILKNTKDPADPLNGKLDVITGQSTSSDRRKVHLQMDAGDVDHDGVCSLDDTILDLPDFDCDGEVELPIAEWVWARLQTLGGLNLLAMTAGAEAETGFLFKFGARCSSTTGENWFLAFQNDGTEWEYECPGECSALVKVKALDTTPLKGIAGTGVDRWILTATLTDPGSARACLWSGVTGIGTTAVWREMVRMPFHLQVDLK